MMGFLDIINEYAQLINFVLFVAIIGWLIKISLISRTALKDRYDAVVASKESKISELESSLGITRSQIELLERDRDRLQSERDDSGINASEMLATLEILKRKADAEVEQAQEELNRVMSELQLKEKEIEKLQSANARFIADVSCRQNIQLSIISSIAHETQAITSSIMNRAHYLLSSTEAGKTIDKKANIYLNDMITELRRLNQMYDTFLRRERTIEPELTVVILRNIIVDVLNMLNIRLSRRRIKVKLLGLEELPRVKIDASIFTQAVLAIIDNSISFSETEGEVVIIGENGPYGIELRFQDFGIGIAEVDRNKVFEPFYVARESRKIKVSGTGLGLYVAKRIIESHGGEITVSNLRMPTEFKIMLPTRVEITE